jgi:primosomal protein N'
MNKGIPTQGAVIANQNGSQMSYKKKCEKCGDLSGSTHTCSVPGPRQKHTSNFRCMKCGNQQQIEIIGE